MNVNLLENERLEFNLIIKRTYSKKVNNILSQLFLLNFKIDHCLIQGWNFNNIFLIIFLLITHLVK